MSIEKEERVHRKEIFDGKLLHVYLDDVKLAGKDRKREVVLHGGAAAIIPVTEDGKILFVRQYRYAAEQEMLEIPAGKLDPGESADICAARELEEETGYTGTLKKLGHVYTTPGFCNEKIDLYLADHLKKTHQHLDEGEFLDVVPFPLDEVKEMIRSGKIIDAKTLSAFAIAYDTLWGK